MDLASGPRILAVWTDAEARVTLPSQARGLGQEGRCDLAASGRAGLPDGQGRHLAQGFWGQLISAVGEEFGDLQLCDSPAPWAALVLRAPPGLGSLRKAGAQAPGSENIVGGAPCLPGWKVDLESPSIGPVGLPGSGEF